MCWRKVKIDIIFEYIIIEGIEILRNLNNHDRESQIKEDMQEWGSRDEDVIDRHRSSSEIEM